MNTNTKQLQSINLRSSAFICGFIFFSLLTGCSTVSKGTLRPSDSPYDLAIDGDGFFIVETGQGGYLFTRRGNFVIDSNRYLVTSDGYKLAPAIKVPEQSGTLNVTLDGNVTTVLPNSNVVSYIGNIRLAMFPNPSGLDRDGHYYLPTASSGEPVTQKPGSNGTGTIKSGFIEK